ncbi:hypothetical protein ACOME3_010153 [Neoechinorhynchus agilis]
MLAVFVVQLRSVNLSTDYAYSLGRPSLKLWSLSSILSDQNPTLRTMECVATIDCLGENVLIKAAKMFNCSSAMLIGGCDSKIAQVEIKGPSTRTIGFYTTNSPACASLAVSINSRRGFSLYEGGKLEVWNIPEQKTLYEISVHQNGATCVDTSINNYSVFTGGLDQLALEWDERRFDRPVKDYSFNSDALGVQIGPKNDHFVACLADGTVDVVSIAIEGKRHEIGRHEVGQMEQ